MGSLGNLEGQPLNYNMFLTFALSAVIHFICFIDHRESLFFLSKLLDIGDTHAG